jgi:hypothetical protein
MRSWLRATKPLSVLLRQSSAGGRSLLFTDRSLISGTLPLCCRASHTNSKGPLYLLGNTGDVTQYRDICNTSL